MTEQTQPTDAEILEVVNAAPALETADAEWLHVCRAVLAKWGSPVVAGEPQPSTEGPPELWLQLHGDCAEPELSEPVDYTAGDVTWCWHSIHDSDVRYVRADLTTTPEPTHAQAGAVPLTDGQIKALMQAHRTAMLMTCKARVPECGEFAAIAQDLDWLCEAFGIKGDQHG